MIEITSYEYEEPAPGHWTPVEKALPEYDNLVLISAVNIDGEPVVDLGEWLSSIVVWRTNPGLSIKKVVAWQPLPDPYEP